MAIPDIPASGATPGPRGPTSLGKKLDSWGEIASYLGREVRTVQRWKRTEGLPVHRHEHKKKSTVYAYAGELDAWIKQRQPKDDPEADDAFAREQELSGTDSPVDIVNPSVMPPAPGPAPNPDEPAPPVGKRVVIALFALGILCAASLGVYRWLQPAESTQEKVRMAVLSFTYASGDSNPDYITSGLTDVIRSLRRLCSLEPFTPLRRRSSTPATPSFKVNLPGAAAVTCAAASFFLSKRYTTIQITRRLTLAWLRRPPFSARCPMTGCPLAMLNRKRRKPPSGPCSSIPSSLKLTLSSATWP